MQFQWDPDKARSNLAKHGVSFDDAAGVFNDSLARSVLDRQDAGEERWLTLGKVDGVVLLSVAHTWRDDGDGDDVIRIISARRATRYERRSYEQR